MATDPIIIGVVTVVMTIIGVAAGWWLLRNSISFLMNVLVIITCLVVLSKEGIFSNYQEKLWMFYNTIIVPIANKFYSATG